MDQETFDQAVAVVEKAIADLPKSARYIAARFKREGITGVTKSASKCPAAVYLRRALDAAGFATVRVYVYGDEVEVMTAAGTVPGVFRGYKTVDGTKGLDDFVDAFDDGSKYQELAAS